MHRLAGPDQRWIDSLTYTLMADLHSPHGQGNQLQLALLGGSNLEEKKLFILYLLKII